MTEKNREHQRIPSPRETLPDYQQPALTDPNLKMGDFLNLTPRERETLLHVNPRGKEILAEGSRFEQEQRRRSDEAANELLKSFHLPSVVSGGLEPARIDLSAAEIYHLLARPFTYDYFDCLEVIGLFQLADSWKWLSFGGRLTNPFASITENGLRDGYHQLIAKKSEAERQIFDRDLSWYFAMNERRYRAFFNNWYPVWVAQIKKEEQAREAQKTEQLRLETGYKQFLMLSPLQRIEHIRRRGKQGKKDYQLFRNWELLSKPKANQAFDNIANIVHFNISHREVERLLNKQKPEELWAVDVYKLFLVYRFAASTGVFGQAHNDLGSKVYEQLRTRIMPLDDRFARDLGMINSHFDKNFRNVVGEIKKDDDQYKNLRTFFKLNERKFLEFFTRWLKKGRWKL